MIALITSIQLFKKVQIKHHYIEAYIMFNTINKFIIAKIEATYDFNITYSKNIEEIATSLNIEVSKIVAINILNVMGDWHIVVGCKCGKLM